MANWTQKKILMTMGGVALSVCGLAGGGIYYTNGLIDEVGVKVAEKKAAIAVADAKINRIPTIEKNVIILRENLGEYVKILPDDRELTGFIRMLQKFERQSGIRSTGLLQKNVRGSKVKARFSPIEYTYAMTATLWQGLKFMNLVENFERFVSVTEFSIIPGESDDETIDGEVVHTINLTMQTYTYNKSGEGKDVTIPDYEDRKDELREEIWKRMQLIRIDRYEHPGMQGRRDIFVDPRETGLGAGTYASHGDQLKVIEKHVAAIADMTKTLEMIRSEGTTLFEQYSLEKRLTSSLATVTGEVDTDASMIVYRPYRLRWAQDVMAPLEELRQQQQQIAGGLAGDLMQQDPYLPAEDISELIAQMTGDCSDGQLEQARERYESVRERLAIPEDDDRYSLAIEAKSWHHKAATALDFKGLDLDVQGVVVNGTGRSGVLMNGEVFEEGDYIADDLLVKMVEEEQIWFVFRGLTLVRTM